MKSGSKDLELKEFTKSTGNVGKGASEAEQHVQKLLKQSTCTTDELHAYLNNIDSKLAEEFKKTGQWPEEVQIPITVEQLEGLKLLKQIKKGG